MDIVIGIIIFIVGGVFGFGTAAWLIFSARKKELDEAYNAGRMYERNRMLNAIDKVYHQGNTVGEDAESCAEVVAE